MPHLEASSWVHAYLTSVGVKPSANQIRFNPETTIVSQRRKNTEQGA